MNKNLKDELQKAKNDFKSIKTIYKQIPNILTTSRLLLTIPINILFFTGDILNAFRLSCIAFCTDWVDGMSARILKAKSKLGADLDALFDKLLIAGISVPMVILNPVMIINIALEGLISIPNIKAKRKGQKPKSSYVGKAKTVVLAATILGGYIVALKGINLNIIQSLLAITPAAGMQIATLVGYINRNKKEEKKIHSEISETTKLNIQNEEIDVKVKQKEKVYGPATLEELKALKQELLIPNQELNYSKTKTRLN